MKLFKSTLFIMAILYLISASTLHVWTHPFFMFIISGIIGIGYRMIHPTKIVKRYPKWAKSAT
jgi:hypothetical protein